MIWKNYKYYIVLHIVLAIYAFLGISSKLAAGETFLSAKFIMWYGVVIFNLFIYAIVWQQILKHLNLVTAYANKAVTIVWGVFWGFLLFDEKITINKLIGMIIIIVGVILVVKSEEASEV